MNILLLEDDEISRLGLSVLLKDRGKVFEFTQGNTALTELDEFDFDIAFIDLDLEEDLIGLEVLDRLAKTKCHCVVLTGHDESEIIMKAYELGAKDYLTKPISEQTLESVFHRYKTEKLMKDINNEYLKQIPNDIRQQLQAFSFEQQAILIRGETGTGKTECAKSLHTFFESVYEKNLPFVAININELSENLVESELFGHVKGAFTGAHGDKEGIFEKANGGVLFIDEVGSLNESIQIKLLKVLDEKKVSRVGEASSHDVDFILISATCDPLEKYLSEGRLREDFFQRINALSFTLPSFRELSQRERVANIKQMLSGLKRKIILTDDALDFVADLDWFGNYRELGNFLKSLVAKGLGVVDLKTIREITQKNNQDVNNLEEAGVFIKLIDAVEKNGLPQVVASLEDFMVNYFYEKNNHKTRATISQLKISNNQFYKNIRSK